MRHPPLTPDERKLVHRDRASGLSWSAIAEKFGIYRSTLQALMDREYAERMRQRKNYGGPNRSGGKAKNLTDEGITSSEYQRYQIIKCQDLLFQEAMQVAIDQGLERDPRLEKPHNNTVFPRFIHAEPVFGTGSPGQMCSENGMGDV